MMEKLGKEDKDRRERGDTHQGFLRRLLLLGRNTNVPVSHGAGPQGSTTARDVLPGQPGGWPADSPGPCHAQRSRDVPGPFALTPVPVGTPGSTPTPGKRTPGMEQRGRVSVVGPLGVTGTPDPQSLAGCKGKTLQTLLLPRPNCTHHPNPCQPARLSTLHPAPAQPEGTRSLQPDPAVGHPSPPQAGGGVLPPQPAPSRGNQGKKKKQGKTELLLFCLFVFVSPAPPFYKCLSL